MSASCLGQESSPENPLKLREGQLQQELGRGVPLKTIVATQQCLDRMGGWPRVLPSGCRSLLWWLVGVREVGDMLLLCGGRQAGYVGVS